MIAVEEWGLIPYHEAWRAQDALRAARAEHHIPDTFILCEHPPVFTLGRQDCTADFLAPRETIAAAGIEVVQVNRGGRITYHGPGQIVGYFIVDLTTRALGIRDFVHRIESLLIDTVAHCGVSAQRDAINPGIWVGRNKLGAIGLHVSRGITQHGFALNVHPDLSHYQYIVPCGIADRGVTSLHQLCGTAAPAQHAVRDRLIASCEAIFQDRCSMAENVGSSSLAAVGST